jgi:ferritin-like metal-binding protein YciE
MATSKTSSSQKGLEELFIDGLKDIYYAEKKITKALPKMAKAAQGGEVAAAFEKHLAETQVQVERLEKAFALLGQPAKAKACPAIDGILQEGDEIAMEYTGASALDAGLVAAAQAVEHYEIARYGTLITWAGLLGKTDVAELLKETLAEEEATDEALSQLGEAGVNERAMQEAA